LLRESDRATFGPSFRPSPARLLGGSGWRASASRSPSSIDLLKGYFKIQERDDLREIREKVTGQLLTLGRALEQTLPALLALLNVPVDDAVWHRLDPPQRRQLTLDAVVPHCERSRTLMKMRGRCQPW
jgi:hypothetical protein